MVIVIQEQKSCQRKFAFHFAKNKDLLSHQWSLSFRKKKSPEKIAFSFSEENKIKNGGVGK